MQQNLIVFETLFAHDGSTNLAQSHAMSPAFSFEKEILAFVSDRESRTVKMRVRECTAYF